MKAKKILPVIILLFCLAVIAGIIFNAPWYVFLAVILITTGIFIYGSAYICSGFYLDAICSAATNEKIITITFDDGPHRNITPVILDILQKYKIRAAFFCMGKRILKNPDLMKRMVDEGHIIGNHSYSHHFFFDLFPKKRIGNEIRVTGNLIHRNTMKRPLLFRPPYGVTNPVLAKALRDTRYHVIGWSLKSRDTVIKDRDALLSRLKKKVRPGDIILFHDTEAHVSEVLEAFIEFILNNGYRIAGLDDMLNIKVYE